MTIDPLELMERQHGLVLRRQLLAGGWPPALIDRKVASGEWTAIRRGVYICTVRWDAADEHVGRPLMRALAASLSMLHPHVVSHDSAALIAGLPVLRTHRALTHITRYGVHGGRTRHGVKHHQAPFEPWMVEESSGVPYFGIARTAADLAREHGLHQGLVAFDAALAMGCRPADLDAVVAGMRNWPQVTVVKECRELATWGAESPGESLTRLLLREMGEIAQTQFGLMNGGRQVWSDLRVRRHLIEFDGRRKYRDESDLWDEKLREDFLRGLHLGISRVVWEDVNTPIAWCRTQKRLNTDIARSDELYGRDLTGLEGLIIPDAVRLERIHRL
ncbi:hypothetical protein GCM10022215_17360 [Nocardioides fonticola]|uniref:Transcriptional regulator, AbiEi antitoxin, Type IV TA system n=2 Tax=Nocardioides fonticola TaxID=450363 RepID=A0ABP7XI33_9ACTN